MNPDVFEILAAVIFALAVAHTFMVKSILHIAHKYPPGSIGFNLFHLFGEVEIVFGLWAGILVSALALAKGTPAVISYFESVNFNEPVFVFVIMSVAATRPVLYFANAFIETASKVIPLNRELAFLLTCLILGPLLGSLITEPAAMTVTALMLRDRFFQKDVSDRFKYLTLGVLLVNVSIGGVLTAFAAPPVLMVAATWQWGNRFMMMNFGWKAITAVVLNSALLVAFLHKEIRAFPPDGGQAARGSIPPWICVTHLVFLALIVITMHHLAVFLWIFLFFLGFTTVTQQHQDELNLKGSLLVAFFLAGLVVLGTPQKWWLQPLIQGMNALPLFLGTTLLTAFTDNAAITYLGSRLTGITESFKYALVAGAVAGGGLTVIANAPNPAAFSILQGNFGGEGISPIRLFKSAIIPTVIAMLALWML